MIHGLRDSQVIARWRRLHAPTMACSGWGSGVRLLFTLQLAARLGAVLDVFLGNVSPEPFLFFRWVVS